MATIQQLKERAHAARAQRDTYGYNYYRTLAEYRRARFRDPIEREERDGELSHNFRQLVVEARSVDMDRPQLGDADDMSKIDARNRAWLDEHGFPTVPSVAPAYAQSAFRIGKLDTLDYYLLARDE